MISRIQKSCFLPLVVAAFASPAAAQLISGSNLSHRSSGSGAGTWTLSENGYVGTYFSLAAPGSLTLSINASGATSDAVDPRMNLVMADTRVGFDVTSGFNNYQHTFDLPAGTYFVRTEYANDVPTANRQLTVGNLSITGATSISNTTSTSTNNANALATADMYIANFRRGPAKVALVGIAPGATVDVKMVRRYYNVGTIVQGFDANVFLAPVAPGDTTSTAAQYQSFVNKHFNILVPSNMGKLQPNENTQNSPTMGHVDTILDYAQAHRMNVRMHNLIWGAQQPAWVNALITNASSANPAVSEPAKANLIAAIASRIANYVGDGDSDTNDGDRAKRYLEIDVLNEALRYPSSLPSYWEIFGAAGVAQIYKMVQDAATAAGANTRLHTNEYNAFQFANDPETGASENYANLYRRNVENINSAGYGEVVTGIRIQAITPVSQHSPARISQAMHNLSVTSLPITLNEFSVENTTAALAAQMYNKNLRLIVGHPNATSFLIWEAWPPPSATPDGVTTIVDPNWNLTLAGQALVDLLEAWTTKVEALVVGLDGTVDFTGFCRDYELAVGGQKFDLELQKGTSSYSLVIAPGDYNGDGTVDAVYYTLWRDTLGSNSVLRADGSGNLMVNAGDYDVWKSSFGVDYGFGSGANAAAGSRVPEPATALLLLTACREVFQRQRFKGNLQVVARPRCTTTASQRVVACSSRSHASNPSAGRFHLSTATETAPLFTYLASCAVVSDEMACLAARPFVFRSNCLLRTATA